MDQAEKTDTEISSKVSEGTNINEISEDIISQSQEIPNMTPYLAQPENNSGASAKAHMSSLIESHPQISVGGIGAIPAVANTLMSPLLAYIFLILLIIAVMWFVVLRRTWDIGKKGEHLRNTWVR